MSLSLGDQVIDGIFGGRLDNLPSLNRPLVRIYISSTYTDMVVEKNILLSEVYPKLKDYCREQYGLEFQVVDMRWGVRDESTDDHMTTDICLEEIRNCQKSSIGPSFIFLGGQKYGYRPIPNRIDVLEFELIVKALRDLGKDVSIFLEWYDIDSNSVPPEMILQPISTALPNFLNSMAPKLQETDQKIWWNILCTFQNLFREAALYLCKTDQITMERMKSFQHSVIEREVNEGIILAKETKGSSLAFIRKINNINLADQKRGEGQKAMHYVDIKDMKQDKEATKMMSELTDLKIPERLERHNWRVYELDWVGMSGQSKEGFDKYMTEFVFDYYKSVIRLIDKAMRKIDNSVRGTIANEILIHLHHCVDESKRFYGRENELFKIKTYTKGSLRKVFIVHGPTGSGKSCLIAKVGCSIGKWLDAKNYVLAVRFLGTTPNCSNVTSSLLSICQQLCYNLEIPIEDIPEDFVPLKNFFRILLDQAGKMDLVIVILLDALETFFVNSYENGATSWIPKELPENVKIILSIAQEPGKTVRGQEVEKFLKRVAFQDSENLLEIGELGPALSQIILTEWLQEINRKLNNFQWRVVMNALHICSLPLFLYLCFLEVKNWKSYFLEEETKIPLSIDMTISNKYEQLERRFGKRLVGHALGFITASKLGLSESELEDILCLDDLVLNDVYHNFIPQVRRIPPILWTKIRREIQNHFIENEADGVRVLVWAHKHFRHASRRKYLNAPETRKYLHSLLCDYFLGIFSNGKEKPYRYTEVQRQRFKLKGRVGQADRRVPVQPNVFSTDESNGKTRYNLRKFSELPYHLVKAGRSEDLCHQVLFNYQWIHSKISARPIDRVLDDFAMALAACAETEPLRIQILLVMCAFRLSRTVLDKFPDMIAPHLVGRLLPSIRNYNLIRNLILQCDSAGLKHNCLSPLSHCMESPGGPLLYSLEGHRFAIFGCSLTNDKRYVVSISTRLISWDLKTSEICRDIDPQPTGIMMGMALSDDSQYAAAFTSSHQLIIVDVMMGNFVRVERVMAEGDPIEDISFFRDEETDAFKIAVYNHKYFRIFDIHGQHMGGDPFAIDGNDILSMILISSQKFVSIHWSGDLEFDDKRIWIKFKWEEFTSKLIECMHCVELLEFGSDGIKILTADRSAQSPLRFEIDPINLDQSWSIVQRHYNCSGTLIQETAVAKRIPEAFGLHAYNESEQTVLVVTVAAGFILLYNQDLLTLKLPRSIRNVRVKINQSNPCVIDLQKLLLVAGVRRDIFIWSIKSEMLLRSFRAHNGRILAMSLVQDHHHNLVVTSSFDKTIKVWDASRLLTVVPIIKRLDFNVEKLVICEELNMVVSQTRKSLGFWNLDSGALDFIASESPDEIRVMVPYELALLKVPLVGLTLMGMYLWSIFWRKTWANLKKPFNRLILVELCIQGLGLINNFFVILIISSKMPLSSYFDPMLGQGRLCHGLMLVLAFRLCYSWTGSPGVALYRCIYICCSPKIICFFNHGLVLSGGILFSLGAALYQSWDFVAVPHSKMRLYAVCQNREPEAQPRNPPSLSIYVLFLFGPHLLKFVCYLFCFAKILKHDNSLGKTVISKKRLQTRNQTNVISLAGHFGIACLDIAFCSFWLMINISVTSTDFLIISFIQDVALSTCCKFFITAEETCVQIWSLTNRIVLHKLRHKGVFQVEALDNHVIIIGLEETPKEDLVYRTNCLNLFSGTLTYKIQTPVQDKLKVVLTGDKDMLAILGYEKTKEKDVIFVYHAKKGLLLHKIQLKYPNFRRPSSFIPSGLHQAIIIDADKGNLVDIRNKTIQRSCKGWTGQAVEQNRFGLSASNSGGLSYMDLKTGKSIHVLIPKKPEGVFTVKAFFSKCGDLIFYYHSERRTMRVFRKEDGKQVSNYFVQSEITSIALANDGKKLILGTKDGSVIMLVISNVLRDGPTECFKYLQGLVSRQLHHTSVAKGKNDLERDPIIRFRAIARTALHMDRVVKNMRATRKDPLKSNKTCLIS